MNNIWEYALREILLNPLVYGTSISSALCLPHSDISVPLENTGTKRYKLSSKRNRWAAHSLSFQKPSRGSRNIYAQAHAIVVLINHGWGWGIRASKDCFVVRQFRNQQCVEVLRQPSVTLRSCESDSPRRCAFICQQVRKLPSTIKSWRYWSIFFPSTA